MTSMTKLPKFVDSFWDADIVSTRGSDVIIRRMREGKRVCKELVEYSSERAKAEAVFAKALKSAARKLETNTEIGDLGTSIRELKAETEHTAAAHESAGMDLLSLSTELYNFHKDQDATKTVKEDNLKRTTQNKITSNTKTTQLKEKYVQRCRDTDSANESYRTTRNSVVAQTKDIHKAERNKEKAKENMEHADMAYKSSLDVLESARNAWESTMAETCEEFQKMEDERIYLTRNILWKMANVDSQTCVTQDQCAERVRLVLEKCTIEKDLQTFVDNYSVGSTRPGRVPYVNYYERKGSTSSNPVARTETRTRQPLPCVPKTTEEGPRSPPPAAAKPRSSDLISFEDNNDGVYERISNTTSGKRIANVVHSYDAKMAFEMSVKLGDRVEVLHSRDGYVQIKVGTRVGAIPESCVRY